MTLRGVSTNCMRGRHVHCAGWDTSTSPALPCGCGCHAVAAKQADPLARFVADLLAEYRSARSQHGDYASHHEAYAVLLEEVQEYWAHVTRKPTERDEAAMYRELVQVAQVAMAAAVLLLPAPAQTSDGGGRERDA